MCSARIAAMNSLQSLLSPDLFPLDQAWELVELPLEKTDGDYAEAIATPATCSAAAPGDVNGALFDAGLLPDPLVAKNSLLYAERVPNRSWWYRKSFATPATRADGAALPPFAELRLEGLDVRADIWLNGVHLGRHDSDFLPFSADVTKLLRRDGAPNLLIVRLTTGREYCEAHLQGEFAPFVESVPTEAGRGYPLRGYQKRVFLRKPAYSWGWDWSPALPTCGMTGPASLRFHEAREIDHVVLTTELLNGNTLARVSARVEVQSRLHTTRSTFGDIRLRLTAPDGHMFEVEAKDIFLRGGLTTIPLTLDIPEPALWWPNGSGAQPLYTVEAWLTCKGQTSAIRPFRWGLRTVEQEIGPGVFRFKVNGVPVFIQGGNWVPSDHLIGRTTPARLEHLVTEAANAHLNCLRVWGGGRYELDAFYEACDRMGVFIWHDFMAACSALPYHEPDFADLCRREGTYQVRRLQRHPCMLQWCGNNEVGACASWSNSVFRDGEPMDAFYYDAFPRIVATEAPGTPYLPTSPYGGEENVQDGQMGDDHHWVVMRPEPEFWSNPEYWNGKGISLFNSEYGYGGPCSLASTKQYLGTDAPDLKNDIGHEHTNTFYDIPRIDFSIAEHYGEKADRPLEEYILLGGLCQGLNLGYSLESQRANGHTWGGIFWMYNDSWGENGWTIIDYYLRRKVSYYGVRRALAPRKLVLRRGGEAFGGAPDEVLLLAVNATGEAYHATVKAGYQRFDGTAEALRTVEFDVPARTKGVVVARFPLPSKEELQAGTIVAIPTSGTSVTSVTSATLLPEAWRAARHKDIAWPKAAPKVVESVADGDDLVVTVETDAFAHAVHFGIGDDFRPEDDFFDLLPGERRTVRIPGAAALAGKVSVTWVG